ncbi:hypothetical protein EYF80_008120 [Liparis tanakae]|uniref:Uncharacterized protein n=1 Tax=Liparis tanakae TaxID=230148 RepID=A0A4Z2IVU6_9TELE|nr:hypothetical protein EYF80_008120 [Liparis tanakae]
MSEPGWRWRSPSLQQGSGNTRGTIVMRRRRVETDVKTKDRMEIYRKGIGDEKRLDKDRESKQNIRLTINRHVHIEGERRVAAVTPRVHRAHIGPSVLVLDQWQFGHRVCVCFLALHVNAARCCPGYLDGIARINSGSQPHGAQLRDGCSGENARVETAVLHSGNKEQGENPGILEVRVSQSRGGLGGTTGELLAFAGRENQFPFIQKKAAFGHFNKLFPVALVPARVLIGFRAAEER